MRKRDCKRFSITTRALRMRPKQDQHRRRKAKRSLGLAQRDEALFVMREPANLGAAMIPGSGNGPDDHRSE